MNRIVRVGVVASLTLGGLVAMPSSGHAASVGYKIVSLQHPNVIVAGDNYGISGQLVDSAGHAVSGGTVYLGSKSPGKSCTPAECASVAYSTQAKGNGTFSFPGQFTNLDTAYVVYPPDNTAQPDLAGAVQFTVYVHNVYRWSGAKSAKAGTLLTTPLALGAKKTKVNTADGAATPLTQVRRGHGRWRTVSRGSNGGLFDGFDPFGFTQPPILAASKPGHYKVRVLDLGSTYQQAAHSGTVSLKVTKRKTPAWLKRTNHYRHSVGLQPFFESKKFDRWDKRHAKWIVRNHGTLCHCEPPGTPGASRKGNAAGANSVIEYGVGRAVGAVDLWIGAPFHATCLLDPDTSIAGFAVYGAAAAEWCLPSRHVFDLATKDGNLLPGTGKSFTFPSHRMKVPTSLLVNRGESPDPRQTCPGHWDSWSVPVLFRVAHPPKSDRKLKHFKVSVKRGHHHVGPVCAFSGHTFHSSNPDDKYLVGAILNSGPWVVALIKPTLHRGAKYKATLTDGHYKQSTTFKVAH
jgi:hypothetical protein